MTRLEINTDLDNLGRVRDFIEASASAASLPADRAGELLLAIDEAVSNVIMHGFSANTEGRIEVQVIDQPDNLTVSIRDNGPLFDPTKKPDTDTAMSPLEREHAGGYGLYLITHLVDQIRYQITPDGRNELAIVKNKPQ